MESTTLNIYPSNKNSLIMLDLDYLRLSPGIDWGTFEVRDDKDRKILFDLVELHGKRNKLVYQTNIKENTLVMILNKDNIKNLRISYSEGKKKSSFKKQKNRINITDKKFLEIFTKNVSIRFEKNFFTIEKFKIGEDFFGPLQIVTSGGIISNQNGSMRNVKFKLHADSPLIKIIKITGEMPVFGDKVKSEGFLPLEMVYSFWSPNNQDIFSKIEINFLYESAKNKEGKKLPFIEPLIWYKLDNSNEATSNSLFVNEMQESKVITLKKPYYSYIQKKKSIFSMMPYLALPNDGLHVEVSKNWFGAAWHSLSSKKEPYWANFSEKEKTGLAQGYYPAHSLNAYWRIGMFFGIGKPEEIANIYTYQPKIRYAYNENKGVGLPFITHWKYNSKLALNFITDDSKINDYLWRKNNTMPWSVQIALSTRKLGIHYSRYCFLRDKIFFIKNRPLLSTVTSTFLCLFGLGTHFKEKLVKINASLIPHTNTHPIIWESSPRKIKKEIKNSEKVWVKEFNLPSPLSHVFSYPSSYGLATEEGTREAIAFSASNALQWIREWPIPNAPVDFFLPAKLYWGISAGGDFEQKKVCDHIRSEFNELYSQGADYMQVSGHLPDEVKKQGPPYLKELFGRIKKIEDVWIAGSDEIIKYYKCRENISLGRLYKEGNFLVTTLIKNILLYFNTGLTMVQKVKGSLEIWQSPDGEVWEKINFRYLDKKQGLILYSINSKSSFIRFKQEN